MRRLVTVQKKKSRHELSSHNKGNEFIAQSYSSETHGKPGLTTFMRNGIGLLDRRPQRCASAVIPLSHMVIGTAFLEPLDII